MKKLDKKGFTLIELLAVIVILGILMMTAIPAVTKAIAKSRRNTYWQNMKSYAKAAATPFLDGEYGGKLVDGTTVESCPYPGKGQYVVIPVDIVELEQGDATKSSFKSDYKGKDGNVAGKPTIIVANLGDPTNENSKDDIQWFIAGMDKAGNGITEFTNINNLSLKSVKTGSSAAAPEVITASPSAKYTPNATTGEVVTLSGTGDKTLTKKATCTK